MNVEELILLRQLATETAVSAGNLAREMWSQPRKIQQKGFRDLVTDVDIAAQHLITTNILKKFPEHGFLTEEEDPNLPANGPIIWIIDPIDGTTNYSHKIPEFCISIAACHPKNNGYLPLAAAIYDPNRQELFSAALNMGATLQTGSAPPHPTQVSQTQAVADAVLALDWSSSDEKRSIILRLFNQLAADSFTMRSIGTAALAMAWVAAGRLDAYFNLHLRPWDVAAASLLVQESGGAVTAPDGGTIAWNVDGMACLLSNGRLALNLDVP